MRGLLQLSLMLGLVAVTLGASLSAKFKDKAALDKELEHLLVELDSMIERDILTKTEEVHHATKTHKRSSKKTLTATESMRAFKRPLQRTVQLMEKARAKQLRKMEETVERAIGDNNNKALREMIEKSFTTRAVEDPNCDVTVNCTDVSNRLFISSAEYRTMSGSCNNLDNYDWGMSEIQHNRWLDNAYQNGQWNVRSRSVTSGGGTRVFLPSARAISNAVHQHTSPTPTNTLNVSLALFQWGQFLDHDVVITPEGTIPDSVNCCNASQNNPFCIEQFFEDNDPYFADGYCMNATRSFTVLECGDTSGFQNQINECTAYIDASNVYGSADDELAAIRMYYQGLMKVSNKDFPPIANDSHEVPCSEEWPAPCFLAGDVRINVYPGLTAYHTIFLREHNRIATALHALNPSWNDEKLFQETRKIVSAEMQHITYNEFLPTVMPADALSTYEVSNSYSYNDSLDASIYQGFSIGFRFGHSLLPADFVLNTVDSSDDLTVVDTTDTENVYLTPSVLYENNFEGVDQTATWLGYSKCPHADRFIDDAARNRLFVDSENISFDLAALNILRAREWGMPPYYEYRDTLCGIGTVTRGDWTSIEDTHDSDAITAMQSIYADPQDIDLFTGLMTERLEDGALVGKTLACILGKQFSYTKHGDRFWYETNDSNLGFSADQLVEIKKVTLAKVMCDNLGINRLPQEVMRVSSTKVDCDSITGMDLSEWEDTA